MNSIKFVNLTPHPVTLSDGNIHITFEKHVGDPARLEQTETSGKIAYEIAPGMKIHLPVTRVSATRTQWLPEPQEGVVYIVSTMVAREAKRPDVIAPVTDATCTRDAKGRVVSVKSFHTFTSEESHAMKEVATAFKEASTTK